MCECRAKSAVGDFRLFVMGRIVYNGCGDSLGSIFFEGILRMFLPYRVDVPYDRRPFANWLMAFGLVVIFSIQLAVILERMFQWQGSPPATIEEGRTEELANEGQASEQADEGLEMLGPIAPFVLNGWSIGGLLGHMWLHGSIWHLAGNLIFLWVFGNAVCAKIGSKFYLPMYLLFGVMAAVSHLIFIKGPMIGASGAINGVVGMYLVFFPENDISCWFLMFFPYVKRVTVSGYWIILSFFIFDILGAALGKQDGVAYFAHLGGFASGVVLAIFLLERKWVRMERYEKSLLELIGLEKSETEKQFGTGMESWQQQYLVSEAPRSEPETIPLGPPEAATVPEAIPWEPEIAQEDFIRFTCSCGKRFKVSLAHAGKTGRCPKCGGRVSIPEGAGAKGEAVPVEQERPREALVRFMCSCGKRIKAPVSHAGRTGLCPQCGGQVRIPGKSPK